MFDTSKPMSVHEEETIAKEVMNGPNNPTILRSASPGADLPGVPMLNLQGGERNHARHGSDP
jgi:hypothetical protein